MKLNEDQIKEFAKAYFEQQLQRLPLEFRPEKKLTLEGIKAEISGYCSPESIFNTIDSEKLQLRLDLMAGNHENIINELQALLQEHGINFDDIDQSDPSFAQLCPEFAKCQDSSP